MTHLSWREPRDEEDLADLLRAERGGTAERRGRARLPTGGGRRSDRVESTLDAEGAEAISLAASSFAGILEYEPKDQTITVGAGTRLETLSETLASEGQWLPPGETDAGRSVGGLVGASTPGPFDAAFGSVRRHVLAVRTLAPDGRRLAWGRAVVKNVAGYDMVGLWCGSRGRLGVVTAASLRVWPRPEKQEWLEFREPGDREAGVGSTLLDSLCSLTPGQDFRPDALLWYRGSNGRTSAVAGFLGSEVAVRTRAGRAGEWASGLGCEVATPSDPGQPFLPDFAPGIGASAEDRSLDRVVIRIECHRDALADLGRRLSSAMGAAAATLTALPESGRMTVSYTRPADPGRAAALRAALFQSAGSAPIAVEAGGKEEVAAAEARRAAGAVAVEEAVVDALGGRPRHWLAEYV